MRDVEVDVVCTSRFYDFVERRGGRWGFPVGCRHLAYRQTQIGYEVKRDMPGLCGPVAEALYDRGDRWLAGASAHELGL